MRFVIYKNSVLASICSMFGAALVAMAIPSLIGKEISIFEGIVVIAAGIGLMWLGSVISERKARKKQAKGAAPQKQNAATAKNICPHCQHQNAADSKFCARCGKSMSEPVEGFCYNCNHRNAAGSRFCAHCGRPITKPAEGFCLHCNYQNTAGSRFCSRCGKQISG